jgi:hypothetical protein
MPSSLPPSSYLHDLCASQRKYAKNANIATTTTASGHVISSPPYQLTVERKAIMILEKSFECQSIIEAVISGYFQNMSRSKCHSIEFHATFCNPDRPGLSTDRVAYPDTMIRSHTCKEYKFITFFDRDLPVQPYRLPLLANRYRSCESLFKVYRWH